MQIRRAIAKLFCAFELLHCSGNIPTVAKDKRKIVVGARSVR